MKNDAEKVMELISDCEVGKLFGYETEWALGALVFNSRLRTHFLQHIRTFCGKARFVSSTSREQIGKLLNRKPSYFMKKFKCPAEKVGAERMFACIKKKFNELNEGARECR